MGVDVKTSFSSLATDPLRNFKFQANILHTVGKYNLATIGFTSVSGLSVTTESIPYRQGGMNTTVQHIPGQTSFTPITFQRGAVIGSGGNWEWMRQLFSVIAGQGAGGPKGPSDFRCNIDLYVLDHPVAKDNSPTNQESNTDVKLWIEIHNAWITSLSYSDLNAGDNALLVEQMAVVHEGFEIHWVDEKQGYKYGASVQRT